MPGSPTPIEVFCSYASEDERLHEKLETHLSLLRRQGLIKEWHDREIPPGTDWSQAIDTHLEQASMILLLISADFLASDYCYGIEMKRALEREQAKEARVIPILLRPVDWQDAPFKHLQALPTDRKPVTTWSNRDEAFSDVAAGIRRAIEDLSLLEASAPRTLLPSIWNVPYSRNSFFIGREETFSQIHTQWQAGQVTALSQPLAISGLGGIGKTQLAVEYAYRYHQHYQAVLWARAETRETLLSSYIALAGLLKLLKGDVQDHQVVVSKVNQWLQTHDKWLFILDNADELSLLPEFLPPVLGGHLLLTTRTQAMGRLARRIEVETLPPELGALFLLRRASLIAPDATLEQAAPLDREMAIQMTQELGGLPLALDQVGAYLEETGYGLSDYQRFYQRHRIKLLQERRGLVADHPESVMTTWSLSFERVEQKSPAAADLLRLCACLAPEDISEQILTQGASHLGPLLEPVATDLSSFGQVLETLRAYSLLRRDPERKTLLIHRLVQAVLRDTMSAETRKLWAGRAVRALNELFPDLSNLNFFEAFNDAGLACHRYLSHAQAALACTEQWEVEGAEVTSLRYRMKACEGYMEAFNEMPSVLKVVFLLVLEGFSSAEIAKMLQTSASEVKKYWYRSRRHMQLALNRVKS